MPQKPDALEAEAELTVLRERVADLERQLEQQRGATEDLWTLSERFRRQSATMARIAMSSAIGEGRVEDLARDITESTAAVCEVERVGVWLFDKGETLLRCVDMYQATQRSHLAGGELREPEYRNEFAALKTSRYVAADDPLSDPRTAGYVEGYLKPNRITSMLDVVIHSRGRNLGVLCLEHVDKPHRWEPDEVAFACQLADQLALALGERQRLRAERERQALQEQLVQAQKMESIGRLAGGVAHDINNFLGVILGNADLAIGMLEPESPPWLHLSEILSATRSSAEIVRQLLAFARRQAAAPVVLDLNMAVDSTLRLLRRLLREDITLRWSPTEDLWNVKMDPSQIDQIVANLVVNARDALVDAKRGGTIHVETRNVAPGSPASSKGGLAGEYVQLAISDDGPGFSREALQHVFEPFFTTKEKGRGTGLGLSTVYGIIHQNQGHIRIESEPDRGTRFEIFLPRCQEAVPEPRAQSTLAPRGGAETILLVEDQEMVRRATGAMLESLGYRVLAAASPQEALRRAGEHDGEIQLVITDVVMPKMNGVELARQLRKLRPGLRCLFMSGYTENVIAKDQVLQPGVLLLEKPFSLDRLDTMVRQALAAPAVPV
ncbi:MAG: response regulator [Myxococcales bacterium]|nr:response regulator [Myxococcales bacterium]